MGGVDRKDNGTVISDKVYNFLEKNALDVLDMVYDRAMEGDGQSLKMLFDAIVTAARAEGSTDGNVDTLDEVLRRIYGDTASVSAKVDQ
jgi:hypothetical protein